jgi:uncharacterized RDD family membrane protein YckC
MEQIPVNKFPTASAHDAYANPYAFDNKGNMEQLSSTYSSSIFFRRWAATIIDFLLIALTTGAAAYLFKEVPQLLVLAPLLIAICYYLLLEGLTGYTAGKFALRIQAVNANGQPPGFVKGLIRTLLRLVDTNPVLFGGLPAGISVLATRKKQRIGDMVANTYVVKVKDLPPTSRKKTIVMTIAFPVYAVLVLVLTIMALANIDTTPKEPERFLSLDGQFQITAPADWRKDTSLNDEADISISNLFSEKYLFVLSESKSDFEEGYTLSDYHQDMEAALELTASDKIYSPTAETFIGNYPAYQLSFESEYDGMKIAYIVTTIETDTHYHQVFAWTLASKYDSVQAELHDVVSSLEETIPEA